jgi:hypothetical protein
MGFKCDGGFAMSGMNLISGVSFSTCPYNVVVIDSMGRMEDGCHI